MTPEKLNTKRNLGETYIDFPLVRGNRQSLLTKLRVWGWREKGGQKGKRMREGERGGEVVSFFLLGLSPFSLLLLRLRMKYNLDHFLACVNFGSNKK